MRGAGSWSWPGLGLFGGLCTAEAGKAWGKSLLGAGASQLPACTLSLSSLSSWPPEPGSFSMELASGECSAGGGEGWPMRGAFQAFFTSSREPGSCAQSVERLPCTRGKRISLEGENKGGGGAFKQRGTALGGGGMEGLYNLMNPVLQC